MATVSSDNTSSCWCHSWRNIRHAHLLALFGAWQQGPRLIVAMELADRTLLQRLREAQGQGLPGIPLQELLGYLLEAAKGIDHLNLDRHIQHDPTLTQEGARAALMAGARPLADDGGPPDALRDYAKGAGILDVHGQTGSAGELCTNVHLFPSQRRRVQNLPRALVYHAWNHQPDALAGKSLALSFQ